VLSFERRDAASPLWIAYAQFVRTFLLPLCAYIYLGWPLSATQQRRDGCEPADLAPFLPLIRRWRSPLLSLVTLPLLLENRSDSGFRRPRLSEEAAAFAVRHLLRSTRKSLRALAPSLRASRWSRYIETASHYDSADHAAKQRFVRSTLDAIRPVRVLDVGANSGMYSPIAAEHGASVVAWDSDVQASELNWRTAQGEGLSILALVADFARPTPAVGWQNREYASLLDRARGQFDCVMMLGILHHLLITDQIPLAAVVAQLREITTRWLICEWIPREDSQFDQLCRGRHELYAHLNEEHFVQAVSRSFTICRREQLGNGRSLWLAERIR
jgi:SAM-dependent methyltransferase